MSLSGSLRNFLRTPRAKEKRERIRAKERARTGLLFVILEASGGAEDTQSDSVRTTTAVSTCHVESSLCQFRHFVVFHVQFGYSDMPWLSLLILSVSCPPSRRGRRASTRVRIVAQRATERLRECIFSITPKKESDWVVKRLFLAEVFLHTWPEVVHVR